MARTMLSDSKLSNTFWVRAVEATIHILNKGMLRSNSDKTPYELWKERLANGKHYKVFGSKFYIKWDDLKIGKLDSRVDERIFVGFSTKSKAYKCYNLRLKKIVESINVTFDEGCRTLIGQDSIGQEIKEPRKYEKVKEEEPLEE